MQKLLTALTPMAPDQSGAVAALFELGGIIIICDAGGCTGNICGFDEPRWRKKKSAVFSLGLRDIDAILGRDDRLISKTKDLVEKFHANFVALIGTPVPTVIATDYAGIARIGEKKFNIPVIHVPCTGTKYYDQGASNAWMALAQKVLVHSDTKPKNFALGILGATPLDLGVTDVEQILPKEILGFNNYKVIGFSDFNDFINLPSYKHNVVLSSAGLELAKFCQEQFGTPYTISYPTEKLLTLYPEIIAQSTKCQKILIIQEQVLAISLRQTILKINPDAQITIGTFFEQIVQLKEPKDQKFNYEDDLRTFLEHETFDLIIGEDAFQRIVPNTGSKWLDLPHFAISGRLIKTMD